MRFTLFSLVLLLSTCGRAPEDVQLKEANFFDLAGYIDAEASRLSGQPLTVDKSITLNGTTERREISDLNFKDDLQLFAVADINKIAWVDKYDTEIEELSGRHRIIRYTALDSTLSTQLLEIEEDRGQPRRIHIVRRTGTWLSEGRSDMVYEPARGYRVKTEQENRFGDDVHADVHTRW